VYPTLLQVAWFLQGLLPHGSMSKT